MIVFFFNCVCDSIINFFFPPKKKVLFRRLLLLTVYVSQYNDAEYREFSVLIVLIGIFGMQLFVRPFKNMTDNILEIFSLAVLVSIAASKSSLRSQGKFCIDELLFSKPFLFLSFFLFFPFFFLRCSHHLYFL